MVDLQELPARMRRLPVDKHHRPVPWFVAWVDGQPDFRVIGEGKIQDAIRYSRCWVCGDTVSAYKAFPIGPMCVINRVTAEPPSHRDCAEYSVRICPFLATPNMRRRESNLPDGTEEPAGIFLRRNPGATAVYTTRRYAIEWHDGGILFRLGDPTSVSWWCEGRPATHAEVMTSIESGLPELQKLAEDDGPQAVKALEGMYAAALPLLPAAETTGDLT